jgi:hypothetical protein
MTEIRTAHGPGARVTRLTLFSPEGKRIRFPQVKTYKYERGILFYTDGDGISCETTLPYAIEHFYEGYEKAPFQ